MIYAIRCKNTDYIKIGYTDDRLIRTRLSTLQIGCPFELELVAVGPGSIADEQRIHAQLKCDGVHYRGEWFISSRQTQAVIDALKAHERPETPIPLMTKGRARLARVSEYAKGLDKSAKSWKPVDPIEKRRKERIEWWADKGVVRVE